MCDKRVQQLVGMRDNVCGQTTPRPPPQAPVWLQEALTNYLNRPTAKRGGAAALLLGGGFILLHRSSPARLNG